MGGSLLLGVWPKSPLELLKNFTKLIRGINTALKVEQWAE
jgi:hypothetical protein